MSGNKPGFISRGAIVRVSGKREVIKDYYFTGHSHYVDALMLEFKSGKLVEFDRALVKPPLGELPDFLKNFETTGATVAIKGKAGSWQVSKWYFSQSEDQEKPELHMELFNDKGLYISTVYSPENIRPFGQPDEAAKPTMIKVFRPIRFDRKPE